MEWGTRHSPGLTIENEAFRSCAVTDPVRVPVTANPHSPNPSVISKRSFRVRRPHSPRPRPTALRSLANGHVHTSPLASQSGRGVMAARSEGFPLLDIAGVATYLATSERHIRQLVAERRIPHHKVGGLVRFRIDRIDQWLDDNERTEPHVSKRLTSVTSLPRRRSAQTEPLAARSRRMRLDD